MESKQTNFNLEDEFQFYETFEDPYQNNNSINNYDETNERISHLIYETKNHYTIILDGLPKGWDEVTLTSPSKENEDLLKRKATSNFLFALEQILVFLNSFLLNSHQNSIALLACMPEGCEFIYPTNEESDSESEYDSEEGEEEDVDIDGNIIKKPLSKKDGKENDKNDKNIEEQYNKEANFNKHLGYYYPFWKLKRQVSKQMKIFFERGNNSEMSEEDLFNEDCSPITSGLSKALCHIQQQLLENEGQPMNSRIIVISVSGDPPRQYVSMMNTIFSAQRMGVALDIIKLAGEDSLFLKQGAHITNGRFLDLRGLEFNNSKSKHSLLQYMIQIFLPENQIRNLLMVEEQPGVDFRASCFCHQKFVNVGFVCSVCLSIYCTFKEVCDTCSSHLNLAKEPTLEDVTI